MQRARELRPRLPRTRRPAFTPGRLERPAGRQLPVRKSARQNRLFFALRLRSRHSSDDHPIYASNIGTPLSHRNVSLRGFEAARDEANLPDGLTFHDLRHAAASRLIAAGLSPVTVAGAGLRGRDDDPPRLRAHVRPVEDRRSRRRGARGGVVLTFLLTSEPIGEAFLA